MPGALGFAEMTPAAMRLRLHTWLRDSVYQHGRKFAPNHLIERAAGAAMNMTPYFDYLREKYAVLYRLPVSFGGDSGTLPSLP